MLKEHSRTQEKQQNKQEKQEKQEKIKRKKTNSGAQRLGKFMSSCKDFISHRKPRVESILICVAVTLIILSFMFNGWLALISTIISIILLIGHHCKYTSLPICVWICLLLASAVLTVVPSLMDYYQRSDFYHKKNNSIITTLSYMETLPANEFTVSDPDKYNKLIQTMPCICVSEIHAVSLKQIASMKYIIPSLNSNIFSILSNFNKSPDYPAICSDRFEELRKLMPDGKLATIEHAANIQ